MNVVRLVRKAKRGNKEALLQLILVEKDAYYRLALTYMGNEQDAMDAMGEMIVTLYEKIDQLKKEESFYSWSKTILANSCKGLLRKRKKVVLLEPGEPGDRPLTIDPYITSDREMDIQWLLSHLNEQQKEAIQLKYFHDLDYQTIADMTDVPIGTVKSRIFQGLRKLRGYERGDLDE